MTVQLSDSLISDLTVTLKFYQQRTDTSSDLEELLDISEHLLEAVAIVRRAQIIRASGQILNAPSADPFDDLSGGNA
ncbi:MAG: hypothetical protein V3V03_00985 [Hyphomonadaceae bacterium]